MRRQYSCDGREWVELEEPVNGPAAQLPESLSHRGDDAEPDEDCEKKGLTYAPDRNNFHNCTFHV